jgi:hypothetical protein
MDRSGIKDMFANSYGRILNMLSNEVAICKVRKDICYNLEYLMINIDIFS